MNCLAGFVWLSAVTVFMVIQLLSDCYRLCHKTTKLQPHAEEEAGPPRDDPSLDVLCFYTPTMWKCSAQELSQQAGPVFLILVESSFPTNMRRWLICGFSSWSGRCPPHPAVCLCLLPHLWTWTEKSTSVGRARRWGRGDEGVMIMSAKHKAAYVMHFWIMIPI